MTANASGLYETRFWIVRRNVEGVLQWYGRNGSWGNRMHAKPYEIMSEARARAKTERGARVCSVRCIALNLRPKMRERSSAWVLKRLAEGKVIYREQSYGWRAGFLRLNAVRCCVEWRTKGDCGTWVAVSGALSCSGRLFCRIAKPEEIPS